MQYQDSTQTVGTGNNTQLDLTVMFSKFGPKLEGKCFLGIDSMSVQQDTDFKYELTMLSDSFQKLIYSKNGPNGLLQVDYTTFCLGYSWECGGQQPYYDAFTDKCYKRENCKYQLIQGPETNDLPTITKIDIYKYSQAQCRKCIQGVCQQCPELQRTSCTICDPLLNSEPVPGSTTECRCKEGYIEERATILEFDTSTVFSNVLQVCRINCTFFNSGCRQDRCTYETNCDRCRNGFYEHAGNATYSYCYDCAQRHDHCFICNIVECFVCQDGWVIQGEGGYPNYAEQCVRCQVLLDNCHTCGLTNATESGFADFDPSAEPQLVPYCIKCNKGFILNQTSGQCQRCDKYLPHCTSCSNLTECQECGQPYEMDKSSSLCEKCISGFLYVDEVCQDLGGCQNWITLDNGTVRCLSCLTEYNFIYNPTSKHCQCQVGFKATQSQLGCFAICGDGNLKGTETCDDKNTKSHDGCSDTCQTQSRFTCSGAPSFCTIFLEMKQKVSYNYVYKEPHQNKGIFSFYIPFEPIKFLQNVDWSAIVAFNFSQDSIEKIGPYQYSPQTQQLSIHVDYLKKLQDENLETIFYFKNQTRIISNPQTVTLQNKINGINAPLIFDDANIQNAKEIINFMSIFISTLILLQFLIGSYFNKMIGLETIHIVQMFYFCRLLVNQKQTTVLGSLNSLKYSNGFNQALSRSTKNEEFSMYMTMKQQFVQIGLQKQFAYNVNLSLFIDFVIIIVYTVYIMKKLSIRRKYFAQRQTKYIGIYTICRRSCSWIYDHFVFPYTMCLQFLILISTALFLQSAGPSLQAFYNIMSSMSFIQLFSFSLNCLTIILIAAIYCYEIFQSLEQHKRVADPDQTKQKQTFLSRLQHDNNDPYRANYHSLYVPIYLVHFFIIQIIMSMAAFASDIFIGQYALELVLALSIVFCLLMIFWGPYNEQVQIHNYFLIFNNVTLVLFLSLCELFQRAQTSISSYTFVALIYVSVSLLVLVIAGGYVRCWIEMVFRKNLREHGQRPKTQKKPDKKGSILAVRNPYLFQNQLLKMKQDYTNSSQYTGPIKAQGLPFGQIQMKWIPQDRRVNKPLTRQEEIFFIAKIKEQNALALQKSLEQKQKKQRQKQNHQRRHNKNKSK